MIHPTAIIDDKAKIANNVDVGAFSVIGPNVEIMRIQKYIHMLI